MRGLRPIRLLRWLLRAAVFTLAAVLVIVALALAVLQTGWGRNRIRVLIVSQANQYLTGTLQIDRLEGSLFRGVRLSGVQLTRGDDRIIGIDEVDVSYSIRELIEGGTLIRRLRVVRPHVVAARQPDGRWNLGALVRRTARREQRTGPGRPIEIRSIEVVDGTVLLEDPLAFGAANVPTAFTGLNTSLAFHYRPVEWRLVFDHASFSGREPDLTVTKLSGGIANGQGGWTFTDLAVRTPRSSFTLDGRVRRDVRPTVLDLDVKAERFAFQEWGGILRGIRNIAIDSSFDVSLDGPLAGLGTTLALHSNGGGIEGRFVLDSSVPGWHGAGRVEVTRLDLAPWLNRPDRPSDISGEIDFDLDLQLGRGFPRGRYAFDGSHARFMEYEGDDVRARGRITAREALIAEATATAYGANVRIDDGAIGIAAPYDFRFQGRAAGLDLRRVPANVPVPHVESTLALDYDVTGRFSRPFINGHARFEPSVFLGASIGAGAVGAIDTSQQPFRYSGEGDITEIDLDRFGVGLDVAWMQDPRYDGAIAGHFFVEGAGSDVATMTLRGGGRLWRADLFDGRLADADVTIDIHDGSLAGSYDGRLDNVNPSKAFADPRYEALLSGSGRGRISVPGLLVRSPAFSDYEVEAHLDLVDSTIRGVRIASGATDTRLSEGRLIVKDLQVDGPMLTGHGAGAIALEEAGSSQFDYDLTRADLAKVGEQFGQAMSGVLATKGRVTGPQSALRLAGEAAIDRLAAGGITALTTNGTYDVVFPLADPAQAVARVTGRAAFVEISGTAVQQAAGTIAIDKDRLTFNVELARAQGPGAALDGRAIMHRNRRTLDVEALTVAIGDTPAWQLSRGTVVPTVAWDEAGFTLTPMTFVDAASGTQRLGLSGTWRQDGKGALRVTAAGVYLDRFAFETPARYGGRLDADVTVQGTIAVPILIGDFTVTEGRVRRLAYDRLSGRIGYTADLFEVNVRLDQSAGVWLTAVGSVPRAMFDPTLPDRPMNLSVLSSPVSLGLIEGVTDVIREVNGEALLDVTIVGTSRDPHFSGTVELTNAGFLVSASGARYRNGRASVRLNTDRVTVTALHLEDRDGNALDVIGSLGTHELKVSDLEIDVVAREFEVLRNELGRIDINAQLSLRGIFESPRVAGTVTIAGGELQVGSILDRTLLQPYATEEQPATGATPAIAAEGDALVALNPWERLGMDVALNVPGSLRMIGEEVQLGQGATLGLGSFNLRVLGDLYLYKDPAQPLYVTGSLDQVTGTYEFQGRRFDVDPVSSINFRGDLNPELFVSVQRVISGVEARVTIAGPLRQPELRLTSTPPLEPTDILSLIVFNASLNTLSSEQQRELAVRAGTLAAGFLATPLLGAIERTLGIDILEIEAISELGGGTATRVTIGDEIAPGLVARFSRQFGAYEYDEATIEYYLSRLFRIRATFSDALATTRRSPFRRVERAGIDFLVFFSF